VQLLFLLHSAFELNGARIVNFGECVYLEVAEAIDVDSLVAIQVGATNVAVETNQVVSVLVLRLNNIELVAHHVRVLGAPWEHFNLLHRDETT